jgi:crossover junction endodeoxyribonuclease RuvC
MMRMKTRVLGIDIGIAITGWSIIEKDEIISNKLHLIDFGAVITHKDTRVENRLGEIFDNINGIIKNYKPTEVAVESLFYFKNQKTIINVSQSRGVVLLCASLNGLKVYDYTPLQVKTAVTGYGRAEKQQVQKMIKILYALEKVPKPDDIADAIAVGTCHLNTSQYFRDLQ